MNYIEVRPRGYGEYVVSAFFGAVVGTVLFIFTGFVLEFSLGSRFSSLMTNWGLVSFVTVLSLGALVGIYINHRAVAKTGRNPFKYTSYGVFGEELTEVRRDLDLAAGQYLYDLLTEAYQLTGKVFVASRSQLLDIAESDGHERETVEKGFTALEKLGVVRVEEDRVIPTSKFLHQMTYIGNLSV